MELKLEVGNKWTNNLQNLRSSFKTHEEKNEKVCDNLEGKEGSFTKKC